MSGILCSGVDFSGTFMLIIYNVAQGSLWPCMTICLVVLSYTVTLFSSKTAIQLLSQRVPIYMRGFCRPRKMCSLRALSVRLCCGINDTWVNVMISPLGILIGIGLFAVCLSVHGVVGVISVLWCRNTLLPVGSNHYTLN